MAVNYPAEHAGLDIQTSSRDIGGSTLPEAVLLLTSNEGITSFQGYITGGEARKFLSLQIGNGNSS